MGNHSSDEELDYGDRDTPPRSSPLNSPSTLDPPLGPTESLSDLEYRWAAERAAYRKNNPIVRGVHIPDDIFSFSNPAFGQDRWVEMVCKPIKSIPASTLAEPRRFSRDYPHTFYDPNHRKEGEAHFRNDMIYGLEYLKSERYEFLNPKSRWFRPPPDADTYASAAGMSPSDIHLPPGNRVRVTLAKNFRHELRAVPILLDIIDKWVEGFCFPYTVRFALQDTWPDPIDCDAAYFFNVMVSRQNHRKFWKTIFFQILTVPGLAGAIAASDPRIPDDKYDGRAEWSHRRDPPATSLFPISFADYQEYWFYSTHRRFVSYLFLECGFTYSSCASIWEGFALRHASNFAWNPHHTSGSLFPSSLLTPLELLRFDNPRNSEDKRCNASCLIDFHTDTPTIITDHEKSPLFTGASDSGLCSDKKGWPQFSLYAHREDS